MGDLTRRVLSPTLTRRLALAAAIGMFVVLIQGTLVTNTGSADGCGNTWPLCNGVFVPRFAIETAIEYGHRLVTSVESVLVLATAAGALLHWRRRVEIRVLVATMVFFLALQAALGAAAVKWPQSAAVLALHFGISLIAFASALLVALFAYEMDGADRLRDRPVPRAFAWAVWGVLGYTYMVVYLGAYVRRVDASLACADWPLCNGELLPRLAGTVAMQFAHRAAAGVLVLATIGLAWWARRLRVERPDLYRGALLAAALVIVQAAAGGLVVLTKLNIFATVAHGAIVTLYFGTLAYLALHTLPRPRLARDETLAPARADRVLGARPASG